MKDMTIATLRAIRDRWGATESPLKEEERQRAQHEGERLEFSAGVARQIGFYVPPPPATDAQIDQAYENAGMLVKRQRAVFDTQAAVNQAVAAEMLSTLDLTTINDLTQARADATASDARLTDATQRLDRHRTTAPASGAAIEAWAAELSALETTVLLLSRQAQAARDLADRKRLAIEMDVAPMLTSALARLDQEKPAVEQRVAAAIEAARAELRAHNARRSGLVALREAVENGTIDWARIT